MVWSFTSALPLAIDPTGRHSPPASGLPPASWWSASASARPPRSRSKRVSLLIAVCWWTNICRPVCPYLRGRRHRSLARPAHQRAYPVEHWWWRNGRARWRPASIPGGRQRFDAVPFFWSPALRHGDCLCRPCGSLGPHRISTATRPRARFVAEGFWRPATATRGRERRSRPGQLACRGAFELEVGDDGAAIPASYPSSKCAPMRRPRRGRHAHPGRSVVATRSEQGGSGR